jgi:hypothetical protein
VVGAIMSSIPGTGASRLDWMMLIMNSLVLKAREKTTAYAICMNVESVIFDLWNLGSGNVFSFSIMSNTL